MVWANTILLAAGGLLVGVPIILHLMMQPKPKPLVFPALRFVQQNRSTNQRRMRLRHWILLALRCLLIFILAAALAGPSTASNRFGSWVTTGLFLAAAAIVAILLTMAIFLPKNGNSIVKRVLISGFGVLLAVLLGVSVYSMTNALRSDDGPIIGDQRAPVAAAIIVDTSPRMEYLFNNATSLERAQETGVWLVEQFPIDSHVSILSAEDDSPFYSVDLQSAKKRIETLDTDFDTINLPEKIEQAIEFLDESDLQRQELYILTDMTSKSWAGESGQRLSTLIDNYKNISIYVVDIGPDSASNFSIDEMLLARNSITAEDDFELQCRVFHQAFGGIDTKETDSGETSESSEAVTRNVRLKIEKPDPLKPIRQDGKTLVPSGVLAEREINVSMPANGSAAAIFNIGRLPEGTHHGEIQIVGQDGLTVDDRKYFTVDVKPAWPVVITTTRNVSPSFLVACLEASSTSYAPKIVDQSRLGQLDLQTYRAVFVLDPTPPSDAAWQNLSKYVRQGGSVAMFLGPNVADGVTASSRLQTAAAMQLLPGAVEEVWRRPYDSPVFLITRNLNHPILAGFRKGSTLVPWTKLPVYLHWGIREFNAAEKESIRRLSEGLIGKDDAQNGFGSSGSDIEVVLSYSNGMPAIVEKKLGSGKIVLCTTPISEPYKNLDERPWNFLRNGVDGDSNVTWVTFVLMRMLGEYLVSNSSGNLNYELGQTATLNNERQLFPERYRMFTPRDEDPQVVNSDEGKLRYRFTDVPGHYRLKAAKEGGVVLRGFSINFKDRSTDMTEIDRGQLDNILGDDRYSFATNRDEIQRVQGAMRVGREFYPLLILLLGIILISEWLFSNFFYAQPAVMTRGS